MQNSVLVNKKSYDLWIQEIKVCICPPLFLHGYREEKGINVDIRHVLLLMKDLPSSNANLNILHIHNIVSHSLQNGSSLHYREKVNETVTVDTPIQKKRSNKHFRTISNSFSHQKNSFKKWQNNFVF